MQLNLFENFNSELKYQALNTNLIESTKVAQEKSNTKKRINWGKLFWETLKVKSFVNLLSKTSLA